ncbi:MAG: glycosyltransferase family 2 protein [bacterium]|nr:glycosyltransferase family 2 protein [bacterium]
MSQDFKLTTPVAFMVFNRPGKTARVFEAIKKARPEKLYIIADGPRHEAEAIKCQEVRNIIEQGIDWPCQVFKNYADKNLGCKKRISSGLDWLFANTEEAIIIEDDCLPDQSFFPFCQELLAKYRHDERIMHIGGYNMAVKDQKFRCNESYYFSNIGLICGWATWRRAWQYYDVNVKKWPEIKKSGLLERVLKNPPAVEHYNHLFDQYYAQTVDSWDTQWFFTRWTQGGLSIVPKTNLMTNIGFDTEGAHKAMDPNDERAHVPVEPITFPLVHPTSTSINKRTDDYIFKHYMDINHFWRQQWRWFLKSNFPSLYKKIKSLK